jgi:hypothetical protein
MGFESILQKLGNIMGAGVPKVKPKGTLSPSQKAGLKPVAGKPGAPGAKPAPGTPGAVTPGGKPFDINLYFRAVGIWFNDFTQRKVPYFFQNFVPVMKGAPNWFKRLPQDEQVSYGVLVLGHVMIVTSVVLFIVL